MRRAKTKKKMDEERNIARTIAGKIMETAKDLDGALIKKIFGDAEEIAKLHAVLTSPRGECFRMQLLQKAGNELDQEELTRICNEVNILDIDRHINKLLGFKLIEKTDGGYIRTKLGEEAVNEVRALESRISKEAAEKIYKTLLGVNSIRLFLRVYGNKKEPDLESLEITYTPLEIGRLALFLPRSIEGVAAIDKLDIADLLSYKDDGTVRVNPKRARSFYQYLQALYRIKEVTKAKNGDN